MLAAAHVLGCYEDRETGKGTFQPVYVHVSEQVAQKEPGYAGNRRSHEHVLQVSGFADLADFENKKASQCSSMGGGGVTLYQV